VEFDKKSYLNGDVHLRVPGIVQRAEQLLCTG
jgi:hypothetical protein